NVSCCCSSQSQAFTLMVFQSAVASFCFIRFSGIDLVPCAGIVYNTPCCSNPSLSCRFFQPCGILKDTPRRSVLLLILSILILLKNTLESLPTTIESSSTV